MDTKWLFLVTRMNAAKEDENRNEFLFMWKQPTSEASILFESNDRRIGVFHGHSGAFLNRVPDLVTSIRGNFNEPGPEILIGILIHDDYKEWETLGSELSGLRIEFIDYLSEHWSSYPLYENLAGAALQNNFDGAFDSIWELFAGDPALEAKLEILHVCLTPNGAEQMINDAELYDGIIGQQLCEQTKHSAERLSSLVKPFDKTYLNELAELRTDLLDQETTKAMAATPDA